jgi:hypothetical protein
MYQIDGDKLNKRPELRIDDRIYSIDNRFSVFRRISAGLKAAGGPADNELNEFEIVMGEALGEAAYDEILAMDLPYGVMQELIIIVLAAMQDLPVEEARRRFRFGNFANETGGSLL